MNKDKKQNKLRTHYNELIDVYIDGIAEDIRMGRGLSEIIYRYGFTYQTDYDVFVEVLCAKAWYQDLKEESEVKLIH